ncbi:bifunctional nuclease family protein [Tessaracoccus caeni]|uniref:bifunctional nuclease family protein n=1 Tax=Tessaracoccus caeni TaxID=3031239 RepID=UPI0023D98B19|nr:bifunctional nuclease family protein [Tessaracoccus caeni]MDF1488486.1 bifunctional nuclease family protein [Tessaracoccus caeni]
MIALEVLGIRLSAPEDSPVLLLREEDGSRCLPIWIGNVEAAAIAIVLDQQTEVTRPMTHDLLASLVTLFAEGVEGQVAITDMRDGVYSAELRMGETVVDARPSDGVALALRLGWEIVCPAALMDRIGVEVDEVPNDEVEQFRAFLDSVSAEDFEAE